MAETLVNYIGLNERTAADKVLQKELLNIILEEKENYYNSLMNAAKTNDLKELAAQFHRIKSAFGVLGFDRLSDEMKEVEILALNFSYNYDYNSKICSIFNLLNNYVVELENYLKK